MRRTTIIILTVAFLICMSLPVLADKIGLRAEEATDIVVGKIKHAKSFYAKNRWGDELIMSEVNLKVDKALKGGQYDEVVFIVEGGEVGDVMLRVSSVPLFKEGETAVFYLKNKDNRFEYLDREELDLPGAKAKPAAKPTCCKTFAKWPSMTVPFYINPTNKDMSTDCAVNEITAGAISWNAISGINLQFSGETDTAIIKSDYENVIFFRDDPSGSTIAVTYIWYTKKSGTITAFDMIIYDSWAFFGLGGSCSSTCNNDGFYLQPIATHELGHAIGLDHNRCQSSIMYPYASYCEDESLSGDDATCVQGLYGN
jgi:hypothetical protein